MIMGRGGKGDQGHAYPELAEVIAAMERGESLPQPVRDAVIERTRAALKLVDKASERVRD